MLYTLVADKLKMIHQEFATTGIDLLQPYLINAGGKGVVNSDRLFLQEVGI